MPPLQKILLFAPSTLNGKIADILGNKKTSSRNALVYFEFPNKNVEDPKINSIFDQKLKFYHLQKPLLKSIINPTKREFDQANFIVWFFDWNNLQTLKIGLEYLKKIVMSRRSFLPLFLVGFRTEDGLVKTKYDPKWELKYLKLMTFQENLRQIVQNSISYFEMEEKSTEHRFLKKLNSVCDKFRLKYGETYKIQKHSTITLERLFHDIEELMGSMFFPKMRQDTPIEDKEQKEQKLSEFSSQIDEFIPIIAKYEIEKNQPITRKYLIHEYGAQKTVARNLLNYWEQRASIEAVPENLKDSVKDYAVDLLEYCKANDISPTYTHLVSNGYKLSLIQPILGYLLGQEKIRNVSSHLVSENFWEFENIQDVIVRYEGKVLYVKAKKDIDRTLMFSDMVYTLESIRNEYLLKTKDVELKKNDKVEFLEFGELHALIGIGKMGVKIILRLAQPPKNKKKLRERCEQFLNSYEENVQIEKHQDLEAQKTIKEESAKIFYKYFNPYPRSVDVFHTITLGKKSKGNVYNKLCSIERGIFEVVEEHDRLNIEELIEKAYTKHRGAYAKNDIIAFVLDMLEENIFI